MDTLTPSQLSLIYIALVMLAAGVLGGLVNHFLSDAAEEPKLTWQKHTIVGVAASFMVPLFLNMISGNLLDQIRGSGSSGPDHSRLFVLAGFCLVAAVSSRAFIRTLSDKILQQAKAATRKSEEALAVATNLKSVIEPMVEAEAPDALEASASSQHSIGPADEKAVLNALFASPYPLRSITGISKATAMDKGHVNSTLSALMGKGLVLQGLSTNGQPRWYSSPAGREAVAGRST